MINNIDNELVIGLVGSLGVAFDEVTNNLASCLEKAGYHIETIRIADNFATRDNPSRFADCYWKMQYATKQRQKFGNDFWAKKAVASIFGIRSELSKKHKKIAYVIRSLKNKQELSLLSDVYGRNFVAVSVFNDNEKSLEHIKNKWELNKTSLDQATSQIQEVNKELEQDNIANGLHPLLARILASRPMPKNGQAMDLLAPKLQMLENPYKMADIKKAASRVAQAIVNKEYIGIETDHDCDGQTSHAVLFENLTKQ